MHENLVKDVLSPAISSITRMNINERISFIKKKKKGNQMKKRVRGIITRKEEKPRMKK